MTIIISPINKQYFNFLTSQHIYIYLSKECQLKSIRNIFSYNLISYKHNPIRGGKKYGYYQIYYSLYNNIRLKLSKFFISIEVTKFTPIFLLYTKHLYLFSLSSKLLKFRYTSFFIHFYILFSTPQKNIIIFFINIGGLYLLYYAFQN